MPTGVYERKKRKKRRRPVATDFQSWLEQGIERLAQREATLTAELVGVRRAGRVLKKAAQQIARGQK